MEKRTIDLSKVDLGGLHDPQIEALKKVHPPANMPFKIGKMGHAVLVVRDIDASVKKFAGCSKRSRGEARENRRAEAYIGSTLTRGD